MTLREHLKALREAAAGHYGEQEARQIANMIVQDILHLDLTGMMRMMESEVEFPQWERILRETEAQRPVQYILGHTEFCGVDLLVHEGCLIPRPETEVLVNRALEVAPRDGAILDICTGSGAIAIALAKSLPQAEVAAVDLSLEALRIAKQNARRAGVDVFFKKADALKPLGELGVFDVIVSNPPYVPASDRKLMRDNVLKYEPEMALFVPGGDDLLFYRMISMYAYEMLEDGGYLIFEIYEKYAEVIGNMLRSAGYRDVECIEDQFLKPRVICARK